MSVFGALTFILSLLCFAVYYVLRTRQSAAMTTDVWMVFYFILAQNFLFLPIAYSPLNTLVLGDAYGDYLPKLGEVLRISMFGVLCFAIGGWYGWKRGGIPVGFVTIYRAVDTVWIRSGGIWLGAVVLVLITGLLVSRGVGFGQGRTVLVAQPELQPVNNLLNASAQVIVLLAMFRAAKVRTPLSYLTLGAVVILSFFGGTRTASIWPLMLGGAVMMHAFRIRRLLPILVGNAGLVVIAVLYASLRSKGAGQSVASESFVEELLFGGHVTELRDFAWVAAAWNGPLLYGKSMAAGWMGIVPSSISDFRMEWGWAKITTRLVGFDPATFAGFRLPIFGEAYFNFSWLGVAVLGGTFGYLVFCISRIVERAPVNYNESGPSSSRNLTIAASCAIYLNIVQLICVSVTVFVAYAQLALVLGGYIGWRLALPLVMRPAPARMPATVGAR